MPRYRTKQQWQVFYLTPERLGGIILFGLLLFGGISGTNYLKYHTQLFRVREVRITGLRYLPEERIRAMIQIPMGTLLFQVNLQPVQERLEKYLYIKSVLIRRIIPSTILISIEERQPVAYLIDHREYMVDDEGVIMMKPPRGKWGDLPVFTGIGVKELLQRGKRPVMKALEMIRRIKTVDPGLLNYISELHLKWDGWPDLFLIRGNTQVIFPSEPSYEKLFVLSELLKDPEVVSQLKRIRRINLSLDRRIVLEYKI